MWQHEFDIVRHDDTAPVIDGVPADVVQDCSPSPRGADRRDARTIVPSRLPDPRLRGHRGSGGARRVLPTYQQRWTSEDACGNVSEAIRYIHTTDDIAPQMVGEEIIEMECDEWPGGNEPPLEDLIEAGIIDVEENCLLDTVLIDYGVMSGGCYYDHVLTYTPIDDCGNVGDSFYQIVVIHDTTPPTLVGMPADTAVSCTTDPASVDAVPTATDNCDPDVDLSYEENILDDGDGCDETFIIERIFLAEDCGYNHTRDTQRVHVVDTAAPILVFEVPESVLLEGCFEDLDLSLEALGDASATASDDCGDLTLTVDLEETVLEVCTDGDGNEGRHRPPTHVDRHRHGLRGQCDHRLRYTDHRGAGQHGPRAVRRSGSGLPWPVPIGWMALTERRPSPPVLSRPPMTACWTACPWRCSAN